MQYKIIILILSSSGEIYSNFKYLQKLYLSKFDDSINYFFIEFNNEQIEDVIEKDHTLTFKGDESITPGMIIKTSLAIKYLKKYDYQYIFRTNLSTVINIYNLLNLIEKYNSLEDFCSGFYVFNFITGTGIIMNKNVANIIADNYTTFNYNYICEDVLISSMFSFYKIKYIFPNNYTWGMIIDTVIENDKQQYMTYYETKNIYKKFNFDNNILHFRIKNDDRNIDILFFKDILEQIYKIKL
jgi:hypothetical protein